MYPFTYTRADSVAKAAEALAADGDAKLLAGGQTLLPAMKLRLNAPSQLIDLSRLAELRGIGVGAGDVTIGATTPHADVAAHAEIARSIAGLHELAGQIGDPAVRHKGTIGGSIANNDPAADYPAACLGLGATIVTNKREISADDFFKGLFETALGDGEIIVKVRFPKPAASGYAKFRNPASRFALVGVFVARTGAGARVAVTGAGSGGVFRWKEAEAALSSNWSEGAVAGLKASPAGLNSDIHADAEYRAHLIGVMTKRAVAAAK
ncbi:MAG: xanthine dehydrogenase family protein subunit M [Rhizobiales bacterium]|nr:xanthine dehydrogenase family protein subunit M [Hyphomicrobiales bacterium]